MDPYAVHAAQAARPREGECITVPAPVFPYRSLSSHTMNSNNNARDSAGAPAAVKALFPSTPSSNSNSTSSSEEQPAKRVRRGEGDASSAETFLLEEGIVEAGGEEDSSARERGENMSSFFSRGRASKAAASAAPTASPAANSTSRSQLAAPLKMEDPRETQARAELLQAETALARAKEELEKAEAKLEKAKAELKEARASGIEDDIQRASRGVARADDAVEEVQKAATAPPAGGRWRGHRSQPASAT